MLVSTKYLSLIEFISRSGRCISQTCGPLHPGQRPTFSFFIAVMFAHRFLELFGHERTHRRVSLRGEHPYLTQQVSVKFQRDIGFHRNPFCTYYRAARFYVHWRFRSMHTAATDDAVTLRKYTMHPPSL